MSKRTHHVLIDAEGKNVLDVGDWSQLARLLGPGDTVILERVSLALANARKDPLDPMRRGLGCWIPPIAERWLREVAKGPVRLSKEVVLESDECGEAPPPRWGKGWTLHCPFVHVPKGWLPYGATP